MSGFNLVDFVDLVGGKSDCSTCSTRITLSYLCTISLYTLI